MLEAISTLPNLRSRRNVLALGATGTAAAAIAMLPRPDGAKAAAVVTSVVAELRQRWIAANEAYDNASTYYEETKFKAIKHYPQPPPELVRDKLATGFMELMVNRSNGRGTYWTADTIETYAKDLNQVWGDGRGDKWAARQKVRLNQHLLAVECVNAQFGVGEAAQAEQEAAKTCQSIERDILTLPATGNEALLLKLEVWANYNCPDADEHVDRFVLRVIDDLKKTVA